MQAGTDSTKADRAARAGWTRSARIADSQLEIDVVLRTPAELKRQGHQRGPSPSTALWGSQCQISETRLSVQPLSVGSLDVFFARKSPLFVKVIDEAVAA